jgi:hypothetical protein
MDKFGNHDIKGAKIGVSPSLLIEGFFYWTTSVTRRSKQGLSFLNYRGIFIFFWTNMETPEFRTFQDPIGRRAYKELDKFGKDRSKRPFTVLTYRGIF